jgi:hypothetical protein
MKSGTQVNTKARLTLLLLGNPGAGKTSTALHFPKPFILDCDDNITSGVKYTGITDFKYSTTTYDDNGKFIPPHQRFARATAELNSAAADPSVETIIIDSLTTFTDIIISQCKHLGGISEDAQMRIQDWGTFAGLFRNTVTQLKSTGKTLIFTGHTELEQNESDKTWIHSIALPGKSRFTLPGLFSDVLLITTKLTGFGATAKTERIVRTEPTSPTDRCCLKDTNKLPTELPLSEFIKKIPTL